MHSHNIHVHLLNQCYSDKNKIYKKYNIIKQLSTVALTVSVDFIWVPLSNASDELKPIIILIHQSVNK